MLTFKKPLMMHIKPTWSANITTTWILCSCLLLLFTQSCRNKPQQAVITGHDVENAVLERFALDKDTTSNGTIARALMELNCLSENELGSRLVFAEDFNPADSAQILVIPCRSSLEDMSSCAYSLIKTRSILINPSLTKDFNRSLALNDTTSLPAVFSMILLHELGHFALDIEGAFDEMGKPDSKLGQKKMDTEPEYMTTYKRTELAADSIGAAWIKKHAANSGQMDCFSVSMAVQLLLPGMQYQMFGTRILDDFGNLRPRILRDPSNTHPNLELRVAFMNYYLARLPEQKQMIDEYLYNREVVPIERQQTDPRIFQGTEKTLPMER